MRTPRQTRGRTRLPRTFQGAVPALTFTATINATKARLVFSTPVVINGIPLTFTVQNVAPTAVTQINSTTIDLTYAAAVVSTNVLRLGASDPAIRGASGAYVASGSFTFP